MAFQVRAFSTLIALSKEKLDEAMIPLRIRAAKAKADIEVTKLEENLIRLETEINELCAQKELDFQKITEKMDTYDLVERKLKQVTTLIDNLFPQASQVASPAGDTAR